MPVQILHVFSQSLNVNAGIAPWNNPAFHVVPNSSSLITAPTDATTVTPVHTAFTIKIRSPRKRIFSGQIIQVSGNSPLIPEATSSVYVTMRRRSYSRGTWTNRRCSTSCYLVSVTNQAAQGRETSMNAISCLLPLNTDRMPTVGWHSANTWYTLRRKRQRCAYLWNEGTCERRSMVNIAPLGKEFQPVPTEQEAAWAPKLFWTCRARENPLALTGLQPCTFQSVAQSLYRLHSPKPSLYML